ncbi:MAG: DUF1080 domain-containing protein [Bacteroidales bacterium]|nr:DUF1080 domain-containing protein [Bacteroidales bacterium]
MKFRILLIFGVLLLSFGLYGGDNEKIKVLIIDGYSNHDWRYTTEIIYSILISTDLFEIDIATAPERDDPGYDEWNPRFKNYDVIVQNSNSIGNENYWSFIAQRDFEKYMTEGGGMYVYHSANNAFTNWDEYNRMIGLGWRKADEGVAIEIVNGKIKRIPIGEGKGTNHGPRLDIIVDKFTDHPINNNYPKKWISPDTELYRYARGCAENIQILSVTRDTTTGKNWPVEWVVNYGDGKVYNSTFGHIWHDVRMPVSIQCIGFQTTLIRAVQWLAGEEVTHQMPQDFPDENQYTLRPVDLVLKPAHGWNPLFNGATLEGWKVNSIKEDCGKEYWQVKKGYIECNSIGDKQHNYVWLTTEEEFSDFHLRLKFQVFKSSPGNSGVQFRSRYDDSDTARYGGWLNGPQADIHGPIPMRAGLIYDETENVRRWIYPSLPDWKIEADQAPKSARKTRLVYADSDPEAWNSMEIICEGMQVKTFVNGLRIVDFNAEGILNDKLHQLRNVGISGVIALQLHQNDETLIRFKDLIIKEL